MYAVQQLLAMSARHYEVSKKIVRLCLLACGVKLSVKLCDEKNKKQTLIRKSNGKNFGKKNYKAS